MFKLTANHCVLLLCTVAAIASTSLVATVRPDVGSHDVGLVWDGLPRSIGFIAFFSWLLGELVNAAITKRAVLPLMLLCGLASVVAWAAIELHGLVAQAAAHPFELTHAISGYSLAHVLAACAPAALLLVVRARMRRWRAAERLEGEYALRRLALQQRQESSPSWAPVPVRADVPRRYASARSRAYADRGHLGRD